jgi:hypothetical protein
MLVLMPQYPLRQIVKPNLVGFKPTGWAKAGFTGTGKKPHFIVMLWTLTNDYSHPGSFTILHLPNVLVHRFSFMVWRIGCFPEILPLITKDFLNSYDHT